MSPEPPNIVVIAGPNGAGKSTAAPILIRETLGIAHYVNADAIARGLSPFAPESVAVAAGRIMLDRLNDLANARQNLAFETTLAGRGMARWLAHRRAEGFRLYIVFLWLPTPELAIARVAGRVKAGGHTVEEAIIRRRFDRGLQNFLNLYQPLASEWRMYDNSGPGPALIAIGEGAAVNRVAEPATWGIVQQWSTK